MAEKTYYEILGVDKTADADTIKKAYRKLVRKYHPDVSKEPDAAERTAEINTAYETLSDREKRAEYDELLANPYGRSAGGNPAASTTNTAAANLSARAISILKICLPASAAIRDRRTQGRPARLKAKTSMPN